MHRSRFFVVLNLILSLGTLMVAAQQAEDLSKLDLATLQQQADGGTVAAEAEIGFRYLRGSGVAKDYAQGVSWLRSAANSGDPRGEYYLAQAYEFGQGVPQDWHQAGVWYLKSAKAGYHDAEFSIGIMYVAGMGGIAANPDQAMYWLHLYNPDPGNTLDSWLNYAKQNELGGDASVNLSQVELAVVEQRAATGEQAAEAELGMRYQQGRGGVNRDYNSAFVWLNKAAHQDNLTGWRGLGYSYEYGYGVKQDWAETAFWYGKAAYVGDAFSEGDLGFMYQTGRGVEQNYAQAMTLYQKAAAQGDYTAANNVGYMYSYGQGMAKNCRQAMIWFNLSAEHGDIYGESSVAYSYQTGDCVPQDLDQARKWYQKAADQGDQEARNALAQLDAPSNPAAQVATSQTLQSDVANEKRQEIADKIEQLQSDAEEHDNAASGWDTTAQNAQNTSSCNGSALTLSICTAIGEAGAAKAQADANKERAAARNDRSDIARLQGQLDSMPTNNSSPADQTASGNSGGSGSGSSYNPDRHYSGPDAGMVQSLLGNVPGWSCPSSISQSIKWTPPIQQVCMRDYYVTAAIAAAYGAECEARLGRNQEAEQDAESMASSVKAAKSMCSNSPVIANNGPGCSTLQIVPCP